MPPIVSDEYKEKKKKEILSSAFVCFAKKGFELATINDIVEHSGISKGAIYNYFQSKDEIYLELMSTDTNQTYDELNQEISKKKLAIEKLNFLFDIYLEVDPFIEENKSRFSVHLEFKLHSSRNKELTQLLRNRRQKYFISQISDILKDGQKSGEIKQDVNPDVFADIFWSMIDGVVSQTIVYEDYPYQEALKEIKKMFILRVKEISVQ
jgi:AcrR family transcriptional regulator